MYYMCYLLSLVQIFAKGMEDGGVDRTVIDCWQKQFGQTADFPIHLTFLSLDLWKLDVSQKKSPLCGTHR